MIKKLKDITTISTGLYKKPNPIGDAFYLHGKHFDHLGELKKDAVLSKDIQINDRTKKHLLEDRDILFIAKGENNRACIYYEKIGKAVASSLFFVIRIKDDILIPEYLRWFINSPSAQNKLESFSKGSHIPSISKKLLAELEIPVPPLKVQNQVLELISLWQKEKNLAIDILKEKEIYYQTLLLNLSKNPEHEV